MLRTRPTQYRIGPILSGGVKEPLEIPVSEIP